MERSATPYQMAALLHVLGDEDLRNLLFELLSISFNASAALEWTGFMMGGTSFVLIQLDVAAREFRLHVRVDPSDPAFDNAERVFGPIARVPALLSEVLPRYGVRCEWSSLPPAH